MRTLMLVAMVAGCGASQQVVGPDAATQESALSIVWEGVYGMDIQSRPVVHLLDDSKCNNVVSDDTTGTATLSSGCIEDSADSRGYVEVLWHGSYSGSAFAKALAEYRGWVLDADFHAYDDVMVGDANRALVATHL